ncbi:helix-turn-helix transcriptional regulator [uncultured Sulfitobacter sp.]|uniref:helix-turn-helix domain-containing protein n=1 Tax=uncultured Sulfitobacter sp. TaxID=191468 RepID=UPI0030F660C7
MAKTIRSSGHEALRDALIAARKDADLTQAELAGRLKCHQSFVARVESGERRIDVVELVVLSRALEVDAAVLLAVAEGATDLDHKI